MEDTLAHIPAEAIKEVAKELPADDVERAQERLDELAIEVIRVLCWRSIY